MDFYKTLGIGIHASEDDIKKAYRKKAMENHPDRNPGDKDAERRFKEVQEAYEHLTNPHKKPRYNPPPKAKPIVKRETFFYDAPPPAFDIWGNKLNAQQKEEWIRNNSEHIVKVQNKKKDSVTGFVDVFKYENGGVPDIRM